MERRLQQLTVFNYTMVLVLLANLLLAFAPEVLRVSPPIPLVGLLLLAVSVVTAMISIRRIGLFERRRAAMRALAYFLSVLVLCVALTTPVIVSAPRLVENRYSLGATIFAVAFISALGFPPLRIWFNHKTARLFYRDDYDAGEVLDRLSDIWLAETAADRIANRTLAELSDVLGPSYALISVRQDHRWAKARVGELPWPAKDAVWLVGRPFPSPVAVTSRLETGPLQAELVRRGVGLAAKLEGQDGLKGIIVFGQRKNGGEYIQQDIDLMETTAKNLTIALENAFKFVAIAEFNNTLRDEIKVATRQLRDSNRQLMQLDDIKNDFLSMASHQLRTPLTAVKYYVSLINAGRLGRTTARQRQALAQTTYSIDRMVTLIEELLDVSRISTGDMKLHTEPARLERLVEQEIKHLQPSADDQGITLEFKREPLPELQLDRSKITNAVMNIIDNGIKYSPPAGTVRIELSRRGRFAVLKVSDQGMGVPRSEQDRLFHKFFRATNAKLNRPDGTGIGLFVAKKVVEEHGGAIIFDSQEGKGSTFGFKLPL